MAAMIFGILCAVSGYGLLTSELPAKAPFPEAVRRPKILAGIACLLAGTLFVTLSFPI